MVTSLAAANWPPQKLYEELYCARGDMEDRIKEQYSLFAGRLSAATLRVNQRRLYLSAAACVADERLSPAGSVRHCLGAGAMRDHPLATIPHQKMQAARRLVYLGLCRPRLSLSLELQSPVARTDRDPRWVRVLVRRRGLRAH